MTKPSETTTLLEPHPPDPGPPVPGPTDAVMEGFSRRLDDILATELALASLTAKRATQIDDLRQWSENAVVASLGGAEAVGAEPQGWNATVQARRELVFELACALRIPERSVEGLVEESRMLSQELPLTLEALGVGEISYRHAAAMVGQAVSVPDDARADFELSLLPFARSLTVGKFTAVARRKRESLHPESITQRHRAQLDERRVWVSPELDGMASITAYLSAELALAAFDRLTEIGKAQKCPEDKRGLAQRRADAFADLLLLGDTCVATAAGETLVGVESDQAPGAGPGAGLDTPTRVPWGPGWAGNVGHGIRPKVLVTVPVLTLLGKGDEPGYLEHYGPIDPVTARELAAEAPSFMRILTHPVTSAIIDVDRGTYAVPADLRVALRLRDGTCRTPICGTSAEHSDIDHSIEFAKGGQTRISNLAHLCEPCHALRHHTRVKIRNLGDGNIEWTTLSGRVYLSRPENRFADGRSSVAAAATDGLAAAARGVPDGAEVAAGDERAAHHSAGLRAGDGGADDPGF
jgi:hypothetical protein